MGRRRTARDYAWQSGNWLETNEVRYLYDGDLPIQERDANNNVLVTYTRGLDLSGSLWNAGLPRQSEATAGGIGGLLARTDSRGSTYYHSDGSGNITALMDTNEVMVARYMYGPFGKLIGQWGPMADANEMQFSSMPMHDGLSFYPFRAYEPNFQRWLNQDPIQEWGGINLYRFNLNDPMRWIDPFGLQEDDVESEPSPGENENSPEAQSEQLAASEEALRERGLNPNDTYLDPVPQPTPPLTAEQARQAGDELMNQFDEMNSEMDRERERADADASKPGNCPTRFVSTRNGIVDTKPTIDRIKSGGSFPHRNDGSVFQNREGHLPNQPPGYYNEYVLPSPGGGGPGPMRVVIGSGGETYFTPDHYQTFIPLNF